MLSSQLNLGATEGSNGRKIFDLSAFRTNFTSGSVHFTEKNKKKKGENWA